jgi:hypothetical protein
LMETQDNNAGANAGADKSGANKRWYVVHA